MRRQIRNLLPDHESIRSNRWLAPFENTLLHPRLWHLNRHSAAGAVAAGLFCGLIPGPLQMLGAAINRPVGIRKIEAHWAGLRPALRLDGFEIRDAQGRMRQMPAAPEGDFQ